MIVSGEEFTKRLETLSDDTMLMISGLAKQDKQMFYQALEIVKTTESETEIVRKIQKLIKTK